MRKSKAKKLRDVNMVNRRAIDDARGRAHDPVNPNQVVAGLMLGFWAHMTDRSRERDLWIPYLHAAWPAGTDRAELNLKLEAINKLRNRVAHNERLFNPGSDGYSPMESTRTYSLCSEPYRRKLTKAFTATIRKRRSRSSSKAIRRRST